MEYNDLYKQYRKDDDFAKFFTGLMDIGFLVLADINDTGEYIILIKDDECVEFKINDGQIKAIHFKQIPNKWQKYLTKAWKLKMNYKRYLDIFVVDVIDEVFQDVHRQDSTTFEFWGEKFLEEQKELLYNHTREFVIYIEEKYPPEEQDKHLTAEECSDYLLTPDTEFFDVLYGQYTTNPFYDWTGYETESEFYQSLVMP